MLLALQLVSGVALIAALALAVCVFAAFELGRMVSRDDEQRQAGMRQVSCNVRLSTGIQSP